MQYRNDPAYVPVLVGAADKVQKTPDRRGRIAPVEDPVGQKKLLLKGNDGHIDQNVLKAEGEELDARVKAGSQNISIPGLNLKTT